MSNFHFSKSGFWVLALCTWAFGSSPCKVLAQRKPVRAKPPVFEEGAMSDVFVSDPVGTLQGELPSSQIALATTSSAPTGTSESESGTGDADEALSWKKMISPTSLEDVIKGSKLRLDRPSRVPLYLTVEDFERLAKNFRC